MTGINRRTALKLSAAVAGGLLAGARPVLAQPAPVRVLVQFGVSYLPLMMIEKHKLLGEALAKKGLPRVEMALQRVSGSTAVNEGLLAGTADMGVMGVPSLLIIANKTRGRVLGLVGTSAMPMVLNTNQERIKGIADFQPSDRIALPAPTAPQAIVLRMLADKQFGNPAKLDTNIVALPHPDAMAALLSGTEITAHFTNAPFAQREAADGRIHRVLTSDEVLGKGASFVLLTANKSYVDANPEVAAAVIEAMGAAIAMIAADPAAAAKLYIAHENSKLDPAFVEAILKDPETVFSTAPGGVMAYAAFLQKTGVLSAPPKRWQDVFFPVSHALNGG